MACSPTKIQPKVVNMMFQSNYSAGRDSKTGEETGDISVFIVRDISRLNGRRAPIIGPFRASFLFMMLLRCLVPILMP